MKFLAYAPPPREGPYPSEGPESVAHAGAWLIPAPAQGFGSWSSVGRVHGQPGTQAVHASGPAAVPQGGWAQGSQHSSRYAPDIIYPALYYQSGSEIDGPNGAPGPLYNTSQISYVSDNALPMPAVDPRGLPAVMAKTVARIGGPGVVNTPGTPMAWPKWMGTGP